MHYFNIRGRAMQNYIVKELWRYFNQNVKNCIPLNDKIRYWDLTVVLSGQLVYSINGVIYNVCKNDVILIPRLSERIREAGQKAKYVSFNFTVLNDLELPRDVYYPNALNDEMKGMLSLFPHKIILDGSKSPPYDPSNARAKAVNLLNYFLLEMMNYTEYTHYSDHIKKAIKYINDNLTSAISLCDVSEHLHLSREYTSHIFKKETKKTVNEYINERKMLYAKEMLLNGRFSLSEIASNLGYENYGYFSRTFKKYFGVSPVSLRSDMKKTEM